MTTLIVLGVLVFSLGLYYFFGYLSRQSRFATAIEFLVAAKRTPYEVFKDSSIAYQLQMATFGPFFVWGAKGDYLPAIINCIFVLIGLLLIVWLRKPLLDFHKKMLPEGGSISVHEFITKSHGDSSGVKTIASSLTIIALLGIAMSEMFGAAAILKPIFSINVDLTYITVIFMAFLMFIYISIGGNPGAMYIDQIQLAIAYCAMFGVLAVMLVSVVIAGKPLAVEVIQASILCLFACVVVFWFRRLQFVHMSIPSINSPEDSSVRRIAAGFHRLQICLNIIVVLAAVVVLAFTAFILLSAGMPRIDLALTEMYSKSSSISNIGLFSLALLPLLYQICDISNWQRIGALRADQGGLTDKDYCQASFGYAWETSAIWLLMLVFGAFALAYSGFSTEEPLAGFIEKLASNRSIGHALVLALFVAGVFAIALSTMLAALSATLLAFRFDILPSFMVKSHQQLRDTIKSEVESSMAGTTFTFGILAYAVLVGSFYIMDQYFQFGRENYLALLLAFYSCQLAFFPLIIGGILGSSDKQYYLNAGPAGAATVLCLGALSSVGITSIGLCSTNPDWICHNSSIAIATRWIPWVKPDDLSWSSIPVAFIVGTVTYFLSCTLRRIFSKKISAPQ